MESDLRHRDYLDGWRGLAILAVLLAHMIPPLEPLGRLGVDLFFVLSGYLMAELLFIKRVPLGLFFKRRISRIYPVLFIYVLMDAFMLHPEKHVTPGELLSTLVCLRNYLPPVPSIFRAHWSILHLWSLNVEEQSYLWLATGTLLCRVFPRSVVTWTFFAVTLGICIAATWFYGWSIGPSTDDIPWTTHVETSGYGIFASFACRVLLYRRKLVLPSWVAPAAFMAAMPFYPLSLHDMDLRNIPFLSFLALSVNGLDTSYVWLRKHLSLTGLRLFGLCSYSLYVWQQPFADIVHSVGLFSPGWGFIVLCALTVGWLSFNFIEQPTRRYLNCIWAKPIHAAS